MDGILGGVRYKGPYGAKNGSVSPTNLGGKRGKRRFHQPTFTQWTRKSLLKHPHPNGVIIFCQYFPHVLHFNLSLPSGTGRSFGEPLELSDR